MNNKAPRKWGAGRIAFMARLDAIKSDVAKGIPLTAIYEQHRAALGIGYPSFVKLVGRYADDNRLTRRRPRSLHSAPSPVPAPVPPAPTVPPSAQGKAHVGYEHAPRRRFEYDGTPRQDDDERIIGPGRTAKE